MDNYNNYYDPYAGEYRQTEVPPEGPKKKKKKVKKNTLMVVGLCLVCALVGACIQPVVSHVVGNQSTVYSGERTPTQVSVTGVDTNRDLTCAEIYANYVGSCVGITVDIVSTNAFGQTVTGAAAGSGFVITEDGYILTNYHVIEDANSIKVTFVDGKEYPATLVGGEEQNDIAVIKIEATGLTPVVIGSSGDMLVGEQVTTIGNPLGELTFSESTGIISAKDRSITMSDGTQMNMIQTDCAINSGNSGGPLFNSHGEVIGIVSAKYSSSSYYSSSASIEGLGFAIPMDDVADMVKDLMTKGYVTGKPLLGISVQDVDEAATAYGVPSGAEVVLVTPGLCAEKAGLQAGDIITKFGDKTIENKSQLIEAKNACKPGDKIDVTIYRSGETKTLSVTLDESTPETTQKQEQAEKDYQESQKQQQQQQQSQQQQQQDSWGSWPFGSWGFGY